MLTHASAQLCALCPALVSVLIMTTFSCVPPRLGGEPRAQPTDALQEGPEGVIAVYSERYVLYEKSVPLFRRRPVLLLTANGRFLRRYENPIGDGQIRIDVAVGSYIIASEVQWVERAVRVQVQEGRPVTITETQLEQAPLLTTLLTANQTSTNQTTHERGLEKTKALPY